MQSPLYTIALARSILGGCPLFFLEKLGARPDCGWLSSPRERFISLRPPRPVAAGCARTLDFIFRMAARKSG